MSQFLFACSMEHGVKVCDELVMIGDGKLFRVEDSAGRDSRELLWKGCNVPESTKVKQVLQTQHRGSGALSRVNERERGYVEQYAANSKR